MKFLNSIIYQTIALCFLLLLVQISPAQPFLVGERGGVLSKIAADGTRTIVANIPQADGVILKDANTAIVSRWNGSGSNILSVNLTTGATTPIATLGGLCQGLSFDAAGDLLVTNEGLDKIQKVNLTTLAVTDIVTGLNRPIDVVVESSNTLLISEYNFGTIVRVNLTTNVKTTFASGLLTPTDIYPEASGNYLIAENGGRLSRIDGATGARTTVAAIPGSNPSAHGIAEDAAGNYFVTSTVSGLIAKVTPAGTVTTFKTGLSFPIFIINGTANADADGDGVSDDVDNCVNTANADQADADNDGEGDVCDVCPNDADNDIDGDGICGDLDNCPAVFNPDQTDTDGDGEGDACDTDDDGDGCLDSDDADPLVVGGDDDSDGVNNDCDNCQTFANSNQTDTDGDGKGDKCDVCADDPIEADANGNGYPDCQECGNGNGTPKVIVTLVVGDACTGQEKQKCISSSALDAWLAGVGRPSNTQGYQGAPRRALCPAKKSLSQIASVQTSFEVYPNPTAGRLFLDIESSQDSEANISIYDMAGRVVKVQATTLFAGQQKVKLNIEQLVDGVYFLSLQIGEEVHTQKLIKSTR